MKHFLTLFIILFAGFKLSAFAQGPDTTKVSSPVNLADSLKSSLKNHDDTVKYLASVNFPGNFSHLVSAEAAPKLKPQTSSTFIISLKVGTASTVSLKPSETAYLTQKTSYPSVLIRKDKPAEINIANRDSSYLSFLQDKSDSVNFYAMVLQKDRAQLQAYLPKPEKVNLSALIFHADSLNLSNASPVSDSLYRRNKIREMDSLRTTVMLLRRDSLKFATYRLLSDSVKVQLKGMALDSLKGQIKLSKNEWFKGHIYSEIATRYLAYDTLSDRATRINYQNKALNYTMLALHQYSAFNDTTGLRICFDNLATVYTAQKKYSQAKWFILQSNSISRIKKDVPNIIASLIVLSNIKSDISDYTLAMRDLDEAMQLSVANHYPKLESEVLRYYGMLYSRLKNYDKEAVVLKKRDSVEESIKKDEEAKLLAIANAQAAAQKKMTDSLQTKKKVITSNTRKLSKGNSAKKTTSL